MRGRETGRDLVQCVESSECCIAGGFVCFCRAFSELFGQSLTALRQSDNRRKETIKERENGRDIFSDPF